MRLHDRLRKAERDLGARIALYLNRIVMAVTGGVGFVWKAYPDILKQAGMQVVQHAPWWLGFAGVLAFCILIERLLKPANAKNPS